MDHTPTVPADDRALRLLERAEVPETTRAALMGLVEKAQADAKAAGTELQAEFGREHVAMIVGCNQFLRLWRSGPSAGAVELLLDPPAKAELAQAGFTLGDPEGMVFKLFGWTRVDPTQGPPSALQQAVHEAFVKAQAAKKPK